MRRMEEVSRVQYHGGRDKSNEGVKDAPERICAVFGVRVCGL